MTRYSTPEELAVMYKYGFGQYRTSRFIKVVHMLAKAGYMPTDTLLTATLDTSRRSSTQESMRNLEQLGLVYSVIKTTSDGRGWLLTEKGENCYQDIVKADKNRASIVSSDNE